MTLLSYLTFVLRTPLLRIGRSDSIDTRCIFLLLFRIATKHDVTYIIKGIPLYFLLRMPFFFFFFKHTRRIETAIIRCSSTYLSWKFRFPSDTFEFRIAAQFSSSSCVNEQQTIPLRGYAFSSYR